MASCRLCGAVCSWACFGCQHPPERRVWDSNWHWYCVCGHEQDEPLGAIGVIRSKDAVDA